MDIRKERLYVGEACIVSHRVARLSNLSTFTAPAIPLLNMTSGPDLTLTGEFCQSVANEASSPSTGTPG